MKTLFIVHLDDHLRTHQGADHASHAAVLLERFSVMVPGLVHVLGFFQHALVAEFYAEVASLAVFLTDDNFISGGFFCHIIFFVTTALLTPLHLRDSDSSNQGINSLTLINPGFTLLLSRVL
jgi:hypothetical protein